MSNNKKKVKITNEPLTAPKKLKILFTIVERQKASFYMDVLEIIILLAVYGF